MNNPITLSFSILIFLTIEGQSIIDNFKDDKSDNIDITEAPFALSLRLNGSHICGATIINKTWGITAAHCVITQIKSTKFYSVRSGSTYRNKGGSIHNLTKIITHEKYNPDNSDYDIGIFMIDPPFEFDSTTQPIALPKDSVKKNWGTVVGWGAFLIYNETILSENLKGVKVPQINTNKCIKDYKGYFDVTPRQLCYGFQKGGADSCKGDSGGPLYNDENILIGITSWGDECGEKYSPGVYTNIQMMSDWITKHADV